LVESGGGGGGHHGPRCRRNLGEDDPQHDMPVWNLVDLGSDEVEVLPLYWSLRALGKHHASVQEAFHSVPLLGASVARGCSDCSRSETVLTPRQRLPVRKRVRCGAVILGPEYGSFRGSDRARLHFCSDVTPCGMAGSAAHTSA
jgi:hypothetical protein